MTKDQTQQKRAAADAAKVKANDARVAANAAPDDAALKKTADDADAEATRLEAEANAPSHDSKSNHKELSKREKGEKRVDILLSEINRQRIAEGLRPLSVSEYEDRQDEDLDDDDDTDEDSDDAPVTRGELRKAGVLRTAEDLAKDIQDPKIQADVLEALRSGRVGKGGSPDQRLADAMAIVNAPKNARVASEAARMGGRRVQSHGSGGGTPPRTDAEFEPTAQEVIFMDKFKLSKEDILKSRTAAASTFNNK